MPSKKILPCASGMTASIGQRAGEEHWGKQTALPTLQLIKIKCQTGQEKLMW